ncbi:MAG: META domain-containing protein [Flavobacteriales bacterium]|nr:META domain-containing protein [Flavobacteriales bacterium]
MLHAMRLFLLLALFPFTLHAQLQPGYDRDEAIEMLRVCMSFVDTPMEGMAITSSERFRRVYRSPVMGLKNMWELLSDDKGTAVISLRGTTAEMVSWLENGYAAMIPAQGEIRLENGSTFRYHLADDPRAAVHVGWTVGMAFLQRDILPKIDSLYQAGTRDMIIAGHSQGGALCYLLTAHVRQLQREGRLPADIRFKTYASAAPKPGNTAFAHHYEHHTRGWAFNTVNALDWVPEVPMSIQTVNDFNVVNPFSDAKKAMGQLPLKKRVAGKYVYNKLDKPTRKAQRNYTRFLGSSAGNFVRRELPELETPAYVESNLYVRTGAIVTLLPDSAYLARFPQNKETPFVNHMLDPYLYLLERWTPDVYLTEAPPVQDPKLALRQRLITDGIHFHGTGHEPEWMLQINHEGAMGFRMLDDAQGWFTPPVQPARAADANVVLYQAQTERGELRVTIQEQPCTDSMSGDTFPYTMRIDATDAKVKHQVNGCGQYLPPARLHDVWMLVRVGDLQVRPGELREGARQEFNTAEGRVFGATGCNTLDGPFEVHGETLRMGPLRMTKRMCADHAEEVERAFMEALGAGWVRYMLKGNDLLLHNPSGAELLFRRVE